MEQSISQHEFVGRKELCDERFARDKKRISDAEDGLDRLTTLVTELAGIVKANTESNADHEKRIRAIESRGGQWLDKIIAGVIGAAVAAFVAYIITGG